MSTTLTRKAFESLIEEDMKWLLDQPETLERGHIFIILERASRLFYPPIPAGGIRGHSGAVILQDSINPTDVTNG